MSNAKAPPSLIQSTAGAIPVVNDKGEVSMQKVKVHRYVSGKRPEYAPSSESEIESEDEDFMGRPIKLAQASPEPEDENDDLKEAEKEDPRLRRLMRRVELEATEQEDRIERHRHIHAPEVISEAPEEEVPEEPEVTERRWRRHESEEEEEEEELSDTEIERRRLVLKQKALYRQEEQELLNKEDEEESGEETEEESSEYEEYTDSEEDTGPRLKPVFVRKRDRVTVLAKEREAMKQKQQEIEAKKLAEDRKKQTLRIVEEEIRKETIEKEGEGAKWAELDTDDENDEVEYEAWKLRELKRIKRDKEEREQIDKERSEIDRLRGMDEEERRQEFRNNPKLVTNKSVKGKYKFLQKYYHRGAFFLDKEEDVYKRDFSSATLEDVFDKTILPKVMQVKNFGRSGRTKYTHLVDQDTTLFDSPWVTETAQNLKFHNNLSGGMKQVFDRPSGKRKKTM